MNFEIGDTVKTKDGEVYMIRELLKTRRYGGSGVTLRPIGATTSRHDLNASLASLSLMRSRELSLAYHYAAESELDGVENWLRDLRRRQAGRWLTMAEQRGADSRSELCMGSDRILELEAAS